MDRLDCIRIFQKIADYKSFSETARQLRISPTAVSRAVSELEAEIGVRLIRRTTRSVRLTEQGADYLARIRRPLFDLDDATRAVRGEDSRPRGSLVVTSPVMFGRSHVMPIITDMLRAYPELSVRLILLDRVVRLVEEGVDVAVRIAHLPDSALRALPLATVQQVLVASPDYLASRGSPKTVEELALHDLIEFDTVGLNAEWKRSAPRTQIEPRLLTNSVDATVEAATQGLGIARLFSYHVAEPLADGKLTRVLVGNEGEDVPVNLVYHGDRQQSSNVKAFFAAAQAAFPDRPAL